MTTDMLIRKTKAAAAHYLTSLKDNSPAVSSSTTHTVFLIKMCVHAWTAMFSLQDAGWFIDVHGNENRFPPKQNEEITDTC